MRATRVDLSISENACNEDQTETSLTPKQVELSYRAHQFCAYNFNPSNSLVRFFVSKSWLPLTTCLFVGGIFSLTRLLVHHTTLQSTETEIAARWGLGLSAFGMSAIGCMIILVTKRFHSGFSMDHEMDAVQKLHVNPVPRIGGLPLFIALFASLGLAACRRGIDSEDTSFLLVLLGVCLPVFAAGITEDITKKVSPTQRLVWAMVSGLLACWLLGAVVTDLGFAWTKPLLAFAPAAYLFSAFAMAGMSNAINMIDGLNGLASGVVSMLALAISLLAAQYGDVLLVNVCLALSFSMLGFWLFNFPFGKIFLGDGGAYLMGFLLGALTILLKARIPTMDAWMILSLLAYPVIEVLYSIGRRVKAKAAPDQPDFAHFHQLVQRWLSDLVISRGLPVPAGRLNSHSTPFIWMFAAASLALAFAGHAVGLDALGFVATAVMYVVCYQILSAYVSRAEARMGRALHRKD